MKKINTKITNEISDLLSAHTNTNIEFFRKKVGYRMVELFKSVNNGTPTPIGRFTQGEDTTYLKGVLSGINIAGLD